MIVSSHTISVWDGWEHVPAHISILHEDKSEDDWVVYVPKVMENSGKMVVVGGVNNVLIQVWVYPLPAGTAYVGRKQNIEKMEKIQYEAVPQPYNVVVGNLRP